MSEPILKVLTNNLMGLPESAKAIGRTNIDAQKSISYDYSGSTITAIDGSAVGTPGALEKVWHDSNLSGSGTSGEPLGLNSHITLSSSGLPYTAEHTPYSVTMWQDNSATSYFGLNYFYLRDSAGGEASFYTDHLTLGDAGQVQMTANPSAVTFYDNPDYKQSASYAYSGIMLSSDSNTDNTAQLKQNSLVFNQSGNSSSDVKSAVYDIDKVRLGKTATTQTELSSRLVFSYDEGGNLAQTYYGPMGFSGYTYTPTGTNSDLFNIRSYGITGVSNFGTYKIEDKWWSAKRMQCNGNGDPVSFIETFVGYHNGDEELYPAYIAFYNKDSGSSFIYHSSVDFWNGLSSRLSSVSAGYGLSGSGTSASPLQVTGIWNHYESQYATSDMSSDRTALNIFTDTNSAKLHDGGIWFKYGGPVFHSAQVSIGIHECSMRDFDANCDTYFNASSVKMYQNLEDATASASAEINAKLISSLYAWALQNGWTPPA